MANGMKSGAGDDPFADVADTSSDDSGEEEAADVDPTPEPDTDIDSEPDDGPETGSDAGPASSSLPWKYARDSAKDGREMVQFFLQEETKRLESRAQTDLEEMLDENVLAFDVREAAYQVALTQHLDDVADQLREWGYDVD